MRIEKSLLSVPVSRPVHRHQISIPSRLETSPDWSCELLVRMMPIQNSTANHELYNSVIQRRACRVQRPLIYWYLNYLRTHLHLLGRYRYHYEFTSCNGGLYLIFLPFISATLAKLLLFTDLFSKPSILNIRTLQEKLKQQ